MRSKLPLLPSGPGGVRKSAFHGPWHVQLSRSGFLQQANSPFPRDLRSGIPGGALYIVDPVQLTQSLPSTTAFDTCSRVCIFLPTFHASTVHVGACLTPKARRRRAVACRGLPPGQAKQGGWRPEEARSAACCERRCTAPRSEEATGHEPSVIMVSCKAQTKT